jgi:hypothetical protein
MMFGKQTKCSEVRFVSVEDMFCLIASFNTISNKLRSDIHVFVIVRILGQLITVECNTCNIRCNDQ